MATPLTLSQTLSALTAKGAYNPSLAKSTCLRDLDALMDDMSARRASGRGNPNCTCNSNCSGHVAFYNDVGKLSLGDINAYLTNIKGCTCNANNTSNNTCICNTDCDCNSDYDCSCNSDETCNVVTDGCTCVGDGNASCTGYGGEPECPSDNLPPSCTSVTNCSCNSETCACDADCPCNSQSSCSCNTVCTCNSYFS